MAKKKSDEDKRTTEQKALERKVDVMMSVEPLPGEPEAEPKSTEETDKSPTKITVTDQATAPQLPAQLLKTIGKTKTPKSSLKIIKSTPPEPAPEPEPETTVPETPAPSTEPAIDKPVPDSRPLPADNPLDDSATDKAVDSIIAEEANTQLAVDDAVARQKAAAAGGPGPGLLHRFFTSPWTWLFIIGIAGVTYAWFH